MKVLVDIGNTRVKWAVLADGDWSADGSVVHGNDPQAAAAAVLDRVDTAPDLLLLSNVAGEPFATGFLAAIGARWACPVRVAASQPAAGRVRNAYDDCAKLGVDRWLGILAAARLYPGGACIVDAGTAVTIDLLAADGAHLGGYIVPGLDLMWRSLAADTGDLARFAGSGAGRAAGSRAWGRNTADAITHGALAALCALIERCAATLAEDNKESVVVVTGGDAARIAPHLAVALEHRPRLVLEGLALWQPG